MLFEESRKWLKELGLPESDVFELPDSGKRFADGAHFRTETSTVNSPGALEGLLSRAESLGIVINRVGETYGIFRHRDSELRDMLSLCREKGVELNLSVGPRATNDLSATAQSKQGMTIGYRLRGMEQVVRAIEDIRRAVRLGCRGITLYDEGLLWVLSELKKRGYLPSELQLKISAHAGQANPAACQLLERLGADSINPVRDLDLFMLAALRRSISAPLDIHVDNPQASGGFLRIYEAPEIVRICAPVNLKSGNIMVPSHGFRSGKTDGESMAEQMAVVLEHINRYFPKAVQSPAGSGPALPQIP